MNPMNKPGTKIDNRVLATIDKNGDPTCPIGMIVDNTFSIDDTLDPEFTCKPNIDGINLNLISNKIHNSTLIAGNRRRKSKKIHLRKTKRRNFKRHKHTRRRR